MNCKGFNSRKGITSVKDFSSNKTAEHSHGYDGRFTVEKYSRIYDTYAYR